MNCGIFIYIRCTLKMLLSFMNKMYKNLLILARFLHNRKRAGISRILARVH